MTVWVVRVRVVRLTQADRFLLALQGASEALSAFEFPRCFSQNGLGERLGMKQSQISRESKRLLAEQLILSEKRRIEHETVKKNGYHPSQKGVQRIEELLDSLSSTEVWIRAEDGTLRRERLANILPSLNFTVTRDGLSIADLLRIAPRHEGAPFIDVDSTTPPSQPTDIAAEFIDSLLQLADLKRELGQNEEAITHLQKAADLHRRRGSKGGEMACLLAATRIDGQMDLARIINIAKYLTPDRLDDGWWQTLAEVLPRAERDEWLQAILEIKPNENIVARIKAVLER
jgi:tetratricopeptide (TPR) repeat protein